MCVHNTINITVVHVTGKKLQKTVISTVIVLMCCAHAPSPSAQCRAYMSDPCGDPNCHAAPVVMHTGLCWFNDITSTEKSGFSGLVQYDCYNTAMLLSVYS
jgi:hypothetical protein